MSLILDNLNVHEAEAVRGWVAAHSTEYAVFYPPSYSPERNPTEYFNGGINGSLSRDVSARDAADLHAKVHRQAGAFNGGHNRSKTSSSTNWSGMQHAQLQTSRIDSRPSDHTLGSMELNHSSFRAYVIN